VEQYAAPHKACGRCKVIRSAAIQKLTEWEFASKRKNLGVRPRRLDLAGQRRELANPELAEHTCLKSRFNVTFDADEGGGEIVEEDEHLGAISKRRGCRGSRLRSETGSVREKEKVSRTYSPVQPHGISVQPYEILAECLRSMLRHYEKLTRSSAVEGAKSAAR
jgi:hypothetical protein